MKPEEQRIAILTTLGWSKLTRSGRRGDDGPTQALRGTDPQGRENRLAPNPLTNLNAMHEAVASLSDSDRYEFCNELAGVCHKDARNHPHSAIMRSVTATAPQRAEAFLRTLNLWTE